MQALITQLAAMALVVAFGFFLGRKGWMSDHTSREISSILMRFILPIILIRSFNKEFDIEEAKLTLLLFVVSFVILLLNILVAKIFFKEEEVIEKYAVIFNNKGYIGIPLVTAVLGEDAVLFITPSLIMTNLFVWTYGQRLLRGPSAGKSLKSLILNPSMIGFLIGLALYLSPFVMPELLDKATGALASLNSPLAMILLGYFLSGESLQKIFTNASAWKVAGLRLLLAPILTLGLISLIPMPDMARTVMALVWAAPTAMNLSMQAKMINIDASYAAQITSLNSILCVFSLPIIMALANFVFAM